MNLVRFVEPVTVTFKKSSGAATVQFEAGRDYVISQAQFERLMGDQNMRARVYKMSRLDSRIENFHVSARKAMGRRLLLYHGSGGYGDQIITWPLARLLDKMGFEVHVLTEPGNNICWWHQPFVKNTRIVPLPYEEFKMYDYVCHFDFLVNMDEHQDQEHPLDTMMRKIGIDPASVSPDLKVCHPIFTHAELHAASRMFPDKQVACYQLASANHVRCLPPNDSVFMLLKLAKAFPDFHWLGLYDEFINQDYSKILTERIKERGVTNVEPYRANNIRELWAMAQRTRIVIAPDSMMVHVCGSMNIPCIGLWGPIPPGHRVKYYKNHWPIYHREFCPQSPCFVYTGTFPKYCPPRNERKVCEVLAGISPQEVIDKIHEVLKMRAVAEGVTDRDAPREQVVTVADRTPETRPVEAAAASSPESGTL